MSKERSFIRSSLACLTGYSKVFTGYELYGSRLFFTNNTRVIHLTVGEVYRDLYLYDVYGVQHRREC